ncbi:MAG: 4-hydroxy-tetrahydrodipicolinate reductase [Nitrospira sp. HN-bin3]|uniref:4-hydroxy-tetrahydrodipicolinate reductase n=1 Tax=Nitrospira cf. moscoviensis SBR1015 TaxID=96242 RepID=UPI000A0D0568|nr:4-hydroxy-tetrahydrodipicolinate reductase [Nitrospira cf. moscoviensis SBR1015]OQW37464.1 MAG: 4-hydroxy-tetrahydrodipicolinate reductase [Nitrospira sp. HN-bin3]
MIKVVVAGAAGRMGCRLVSLVRDSTALMLAGALEGKDHPALGEDAGEFAGSGHAGIPITADLSALMERGEVVVDFSSPEATLDHMRTVVRSRRAAVIGTTGLSIGQLDELKTLAQHIPCVFSPNMSVGINLLYKVIGEMAKTLGDDYDIEVIEAHHRLKKDAPSGTALKIAEVLARSVNRDLNQVGVYARKGLIGERIKGEIGIQTIRAGDIVGDHTILFGGMGERIEVTHRASSRDTFARGALRAARWVVRQPPGLYDMMDVLSLR